MADPLRPIQKKRMRDRIKNIFVGGLGGAAAGTIEGLQGGDMTRAFSQGVSEMVQAIVAEAADNGIALDDKQLLQQFGRLVEAHAQVVPDSDEILREFTFETGQSASNLNLYTHALSMVAERSGAAKEAMLNGLANKVFDNETEANPKALDFSLRVIERLSDDQVALMALLSDSQNPLSDMSMSVSAAPGELEQYGAHGPEVVLLMHEVLEMIEQRLITQHIDWKKGESVLDYQLRASDRTLQPNSIEEIRMDKLTLAPRGQAVSRELSLQTLSNDIKRGLRQVIDPNGVILDEFDQNFAHRPTTDEIDGPATPGDDLQH